MSYIANVQGKKPSNPINELNTNYTSTSRSVNVNEEYPYETPSGQNMYNNEPISQYDTEYNNTYRSTLENLRTKTESMNMALESALVPNIIYGQNIVQESSYIFNDTVCPINISSNEYVFRVNMVKFKSDKCRRLCYNKTIHIYSGTHIDPNTGLSVNDTVQYIIDNRINPYNNISYNTFISLNPLLSDIDSNDPLDIGIEIDTGIPSNIINLTKLDYIFPFLGFINNRAIPWNRLIISVDNIDVFAIFNGNGWVDGSLPNPDDREDVKFTYLDIPFKIDYFPARTDCGEKYGSQVPIFWFGATDGLIRSDTEYQDNVELWGDWNRINGFERIFTSDNHIIYEEFEMDSNSFQNISTTRFGTLYNKRFADFDYRFKIKRFNMLSFECMNYESEESEYSNTGAEIRDDFQVESHQFNILKITLDRILTKKRRFKIFYNTRVMYDQDNMLRIKNKQYLADQFEAYMKDVSSNIQVFIDETYALMRKDYGCYLDTAGNEYWYRFDQGGFNTLDGDTSYLISIDKTILDEENMLQPDSIYLTGDTPFLTKKYDDQNYDQLKMRTEIVHFNNMEEGATPTDEFIYYHNSECGILLKDLAKQIFTEDEAIILTTVNNLIDRAYVDNYIIDVTSNSIPKNEWFIRKNLPEMFLYDVDNDEYILDDMGLLDEVFDFTYNDKVSYKENLIHGLQYVIGYDADKLEASILRSIVSRTYTGSDLMQYINNNTLSMARGISTYPNNNYVMIFKNGELYDKYSTITYDIFNFNVTMIPNTDVTDTDVFEFVYYLNINNETFPVVYNNITVPSKIKNGTYESGTNISIDAIPCNTTLYNPENMMVIIDKIPDGEYNEYIDFNTGLTGYNLNYKIMSYKDLLKKDNDNLFVTSTLTNDTMINGLYRVTKQGGGEYFILPSVKPVETTEDPGNIPSGLVGINEYAFSGCGSINNAIHFTGTVEEWNAISKSESWNDGMQIGNINNNGGVICTDGSVLL